MPHMGSGHSDTDGLAYSDHEFQQVSFLTQSPPDANGETEVVGTVEVAGPRGMDNDELAELVGFYRNVSFLDNSGGAIQEGTAECEAAMEINTSNADDFLSNLTGDGDTVPAEQGSDGTLFVDDDPGRLDYFTASAKVGSSSQSNTEQARAVDYRDMFGSGPYLDPTDNIGFFLEIDANNVDPSDTIRAKVTYLLFWNVEEIPEGRSRFARP